MNVTDTISSVISRAQKNAETLKRLRRANENDAEVKRMLDRLLTRSSDLEMSLNSVYLQVAREDTIQPREYWELIERHVDIVLKKVEEMDSGLNRVTMGASPGSSSNPLHRVLKRAKTSLKTTFNTSSITERLDSVGSKLEEAISEASVITRFFDLEKVTTTVKKMPISGEGVASSSTPDKFIKQFDTPETPQHVVLDYTTCDENEEPVTAEGRLLRKVLTLSRGDEAYGVSAVGKVSAVGNHGMGGVGKTTALRELCHVDEVKEAYPDGIYFVEFGKDANDEEVSRKIQRCVRKSGGDGVAKDMANAGSLSGAIELASEWLCRRKILLVCDDMWPIKPDDLGYVRVIKKLLVNARGSALLVSTRFSRIAESVGNPTAFEPLEARGEKARGILEKAAFNSLIANGVTNVYIDRLLDICDGLPLTLSIAGAGVKQELKRHEDTSLAIKRYCERLERFIKIRMDAELANYPCLSHVIRASLNHCEQWLKGVQKFFEALCVLQKQAKIPIRCLSRLMGVSFEEATDMAEMLEEASLLRLEPCGGETGLRLHDLVLELCQGMVKDDEQRSWHGKLCESYLACLPEAGAWWDVEDDGYIMGNLSRHLIESGRVSELHDVVCDVRWLWRRKHSGGWIAWEIDSERLMNAMDSESRHGMKRVQVVLKRCLSVLGQVEFAFQIYGHLSKAERSDPSARRLLESITQYYPKPWLQPMDKCLGPIDAREVSMWNLGYVLDMAVCWAKDYFVIATPEAIIGWSMARNEELYTIKHSALSIALSADGKLIVSGSGDKTVRRWDAQTGELIGEPLRGHKGFVTCVAISADGQMIVSGSEDKTVRRWDAHTGESIGNPLPGHEKKVTCVAVSTDGQLIVSGSWDKTVRRWDAHTGEPIGEPLYGHGSKVTCVAVSTDGQLIVSGSWDKAVRRWDAHTGEHIGEPLRGHGDWVTCAAVSADGRQIVSASKDKTVRLWDAHTGEHIGEPLRGHQFDVNFVSVCADGQQFISASLDRTVRRWNAYAAESIGDPLPGHEKRVTCVAVSADGQMIVSGSQDNTVRRWNAHTNKHIGEPLRGHERLVTCVAVSTDGQLIVSGSSDGTVRRWDAHTGEQIGEALGGHEGYVTCVAVSADGQLIVFGLLDGTLRLWNAHTGEQIGEPLRGHKKEVTCVAVSADGQLIVSGSEDKTLRRWNAHTGEHIGEPLRGHGYGVNCVAVTADGQLIVSGSADKSVRRWDAHTGEHIGWPLHGHRRGVCCVAVSVDGRQIVSGSEDGVVRWWNAHTDTKLGVSLLGNNCNDRMSNTQILSKGNPMHYDNGLRVLPDFSHFAMYSDFSRAVVGLHSGCVVVCKNMDNCM